MNHCVICKSKNIRILKSRVSDFLSLRMLDGKTQETDAIHCLDCGFLSYAFKPTVEQMNKLYYGYRNQQYQQQRQSCECWYTPQINELIGNSYTERKSRENNLENIIKNNLNITSIKSVLDFGGDKGQHIPKIFNDKEKYVYDISGVEPIDGVKIANLTNLDKEFDFIMCCHLLEHVCSPHQIIEQIKSLLHDQGTLYIELPFDSPFYANKMELLQFLFNKYFSFSTLVKHLIKLKKEKYFKPMHEHINFFTPNAILKLLEDSGFEVLYNNVVNVDSEWCKSKVISVLARLK